MKSQFHIFVLSVILLISQITMAEPTKSLTTSAAATVAEQPNTDSSRKEEILILKTQLQATLEFQQQLLSVVLWSLGSIIALAIGLAAFKPGDRSDQVLKRADEALYRAKAAGRNTIEQG